MKYVVFILVFLCTFSGRAGPYLLETRDFVYTMLSEKEFAVYDKKTLEKIYSYSDGLTKILAITPGKKPNGAKVWYMDSKIHVRNPWKKNVKKQQLPNTLFGVFYENATLFVCGLHFYTTDTELEQWIPYPKGDFEDVATHQEKWICVQLKNPSSFLLFNMYSGQSTHFIHNHLPICPPVIYDEKLIYFCSSGVSFIHALEDVLGAPSENFKKEGKSKKEPLYYRKLLGLTLYGPVVSAYCPSGSCMRLIIGTKYVPIELPEVSDLQVVQARDAVYVLCYSNTIHNEGAQVIRIDLKIPRYTVVLERNYPKAAVFPRLFYYMKPCLIQLRDTLLIETGVNQVDGLIGGETWPEPPIVYYLWPEKKDLPRYQTSPSFTQSLVDNASARTLFLSKRIQDTKELSFKTNEDIDWEGLGGEDEAVIAHIVSFMDVTTRLRFSTTSRQCLRISRLCDTRDDLFLQFYEYLQDKDLLNARRYACELLRRNDPFLTSVVGEIQDSSTFLERVQANELQSFKQLLFSACFLFGDDPRS